MPKKPKIIFLAFVALFLFLGFCPTVSAQEKSNSGLGLNLSAASAWNSIKDTFSTFFSETTKQFLLSSSQKGLSAAIAISLKNPTIIKGQDLGQIGTGYIKYYSDGTLAMYSNSQAAQKLCIPQSGAYTFKITARGSYAGGAWPNLRLLIDDQNRADIIVNSATLKTFTIVTNLTAGHHWLAIVFNNDYYVPLKEDRNLFVNKIEVFLSSPTKDISISTTDPLVIEAENFSNLNNCLVEKLADGTLGIYSNNQISQKINFAQSGAYTFKITARGSYAGGAWPNLRLLIDDQGKADFVVDSPTVKTFSAVAEITAGSHWLAIAFTNDYYVPMKEDRNLYVDKVEIDLKNHISVPEDANSIKKAIDLAEADDIIEIAAGVYNEKIIINKGITLKGSGSTKPQIIYPGACPNSLDFVVKIAADNIKISGIDIDARQCLNVNGIGTLDSEKFSNIALSYLEVKNGLDGIRLRGDNLTLDNITSNDNALNGFMLPGTEGAAPVNNLIIKQSNFLKNGKEGIRFHYVDNVEIENSLSQNNAGVGIFSLNSSGKIKNSQILQNGDDGIGGSQSTLEISQSNISFNGLKQTRDAGGVIMSYSDISLYNDTISDNNQWGIGFVVTKIKAVNNLIERNGCTGIELTTIADKTKANAPAFWFDNHPEIICEYNTVRDNGWRTEYDDTTCPKAGITAGKNSKNLKIRYNTVEKNHTGISLSETNQSIIEENLVSANKYRGILLYLSNDILVKNNTIENTEKGAGLISAGSTSVSVLGNSIRNNNGFGIEASKGSLNVSGNTIINNIKQGLVLWNGAADLGDGILKGLGNNILKNNNSASGVDLANNSGQTIYAKFNQWDHQTAADILRFDIRSPNGGQVILE